MLVQPALTTHLLCRPVSIADSRGTGEELQVLCGVTKVWYVFGPSRFGTVGRKREPRLGALKTDAAPFTTRSCAPLQALHPAGHATSARVRGLRACRRRRSEQVRQQD